MTVSAPYFSAILAFASSSLLSIWSIDVPILAFTFARNASPMPIGSISWVAFLGITQRPPAIRRLSLSLDMPSDLAAFLMSSFNPFFASVSSVMVLV